MNSPARLETLLNTLNLIILEFKRNHPSTTESDVLTAVSSLKKAVRRKKILATNLESELFDAILGVTSLVKYDGKDVKVCLDILQHLITEHINKGQNYFSQVQESVH